MHHNSPAPPPSAEDPASAAAHFDWSDFLDFNNLDETLTIPFPDPDPPPIDPPQTGWVRKRDPMLVCPNFLAGRIPCACPELDEKLLEEELVLPGKKRTRVARNSGGAPARCQVPGCEADISELKGYHKRHRVCLRCANAGAVVLDGETKRYCQQCGKFHVLSDFDEDKRSCRRKLERHNNRRRRKPNDSKEAMEKGSQQIILTDDVSGDDDTGKDGISTSSQIEEREILLETDGQVSTLCSALGSQTLQSDSVVSVSPSGETLIEEHKQNPKYKLSPSYCDNKTSFSSVCPAGRISFKLYDWNPAEFPRRLRHQIFQWLASMPVELEGYIRPGCTILTAFIAMPKPVWLKLLEEPALCLKDLVASPGSLLSGRGTMQVYLNDMIFRVTEDASSILKVKVKDQSPKLHYVYPTCFEAGRPMEFVACGSYLLQPDFRFLISFAGRYLAYNICVSSLCCGKGDTNSAEHQLLKIYVPQFDVAFYGPAFIEVENQSGLSNFIPILVGDKETCAEMSSIQQNFDNIKQPACDALALRQAQFSEFILDVAWLLKKPVSEQQLTCSQIQRFNHLLEFLIERESSIVLERVLCSLRFAIDNNSITVVSDSNLRLLRINMDNAQRRLARRLSEKEFLVIAVPEGNFYSHCSLDDDRSVFSATNKGIQRMVTNLLGLNVPSSSPQVDSSVPLLNEEVIMNFNLQERPKNSCNRSLTRKTFLKSRPIIMAVTAVGVCLGLCAAVFHPQRIDRIASTIQRCLFDNF